MSELQKTESKRDEHVRERLAASNLSSLIAGRTVSWKPGTPGTASPRGSGAICIRLSFIITTPPLIQS